MNKSPKKPKTKNEDLLPKVGRKLTKKEQQAETDRQQKEAQANNPLLRDERE
jgi:hypothetical protein